MIKHLKGRSKLGFRDYVSNKIFWRAAKCQQIFAWFLAARDHMTNLVSEPMTIHCPLSNYLWKKHVFCRPYTVVKPNICTYLNILEGEKIFILHTIWDPINTFMALNIRPIISCVGVGLLYTYNLIQMIWSHVHVETKLRFSFQKRA